MLLAIVFCYTPPEINYPFAGLCHLLPTRVGGEVLQRELQGGVKVPHGVFPPLSRREVVVWENPRIYFLNILYTPLPYSVVSKKEEEEGAERVTPCGSAEAKAPTNCNTMRNKVQGPRAHIEAGTCTP